MKKFFIPFLSAIHVLKTRRPVNRETPVAVETINPGRPTFETQVAVLEARQEERKRIALDVHDELGSGLTTIRMMSELLKLRMKEDTPPEIEKISAVANELLVSMNTIVWTLVTSDDSVESLVAYIRAYAMEFFENTQVECRFDIALSLSAAEMSGEKRRQVFLAVKECLTNVLKHAQASAVVITICASEELFIEIKDNGRAESEYGMSKPGNGIRNMQKRMEQAGGCFHMENHDGTVAIFRTKI
jgi:signal transduction histidine kinase